MAGQNEILLLVQRIEEEFKGFSEGNKSDLRRISSDLQQGLRELSSLAIRTGTTEENITEMKSDIKNLENKVHNFSVNFMFLTGGIAGIWAIIRFVAPILERMK